MGCFNDNNGGRDLTGSGPDAVASDPVNAAEECVAFCSGYTYFALQWTNECFCGNTYGSQGAAPLSSCDADSTITNGVADLCANGVADCGNVNAVYELTSANVCDLDQIVDQATDTTGAVATPHPLVFGCVNFETVYCEYVVTDGNYADALGAYAACSAAPRDGYCSAVLPSAQHLRNGDVCTGGANSNIGFHIRIPFNVNTEGTYAFRMHADYGNGAFIGIDTPIATTGNTWGMLVLVPIALTVGGHQFEAL